MSEQRPAAQHGAGSEEARARQRLAAQTEVSDAIAAARSIGDVVDRVLAAIGTTYDFAFGGYWCLDEAGEAMRLQRMWTSAAATARRFGEQSFTFTPRYGEGLPGRVWASGQPAWILDVEHDRNFPRAALALETGMRSGLAFPLIDSQGVNGVLEFFAMEPREPDVDMLYSAAAFGAQVGQFLEREREQRATRAGAARLRAILESALDCIVTMDHEGIVREFNPAAERTFGYTRDEAVGQRLGSLIVPPSLRERHERGLANYLKTGEGPVLGKRLEIMGMRKDGSEFPVELAIMPVPVDGPPLFTGYLRDLSERHRTERRWRFLADASARLASSLDYETTLREVARLAVPEIADWCAVDIVNERGTVQRLAVEHVNPEAKPIVERIGPKGRRGIAEHGVAQVLRSRKPELMNDLSVADLAARGISEDDLASVQALGPRAVMTVPLIARDELLGALTFVSARPDRRYDDADLALAQELASRAAIAVDNARLFRQAEQTRERLEQQAAELEMQADQLHESHESLADANLRLQRLNDELRGHAEELERARADAERANRAKSEFLAMMSHELRTPLNAIGGYSQLMALGIHGPVSEQQREDLDRIERSQAHLLRLINDVLNFAKLEAGHVEFHVADVGVHSMVSEVEALVRPQIESKALSYECRAGDPDVTARVDRERAQQVLLNLLTNAVKYSEPKDRIVVSWTATDTEVVVEVCDTGIGIPPEKQTEIFEPFVQVGRELTQVGGVGLGLAISRDIARAMNGDLTVRSVVGEGSTFVFTMPRGTRARESERGERLGEK